MKIVPMPAVTFTKPLPSNPWNESVGPGVSPGLSSFEKVMMLVGVTDTLTVLVPLTNWPSLWRQVTVTSEINGDPKKSHCDEPAPSWQSGNVVVVAESDRVVSLPGGVNAEWLPPPPPPQLASTKLASS